MIYGGFLSLKLQQILTPEDTTLVQSITDFINTTRACECDVTRV